MSDAGNQRNKDIGITEKSENNATSEQRETGEIDEVEKETGENGENSEDEEIQRDWRTLKAFDEVKSNDWTGKVFFYEDCGNPKDVKEVEMTESEMMEKLVASVKNEKIEKMEMWIQTKEDLLLNALIAIKTEQFWWSIEKNTKGITIQKSENWEHVVYEYRREKRTAGVFEGGQFEKILWVDGNPDQLPVSLHDVIRKLNQTQKLEKQYQVGNPRDFATDLFTDHFCLQVNKLEDGLMERRGVKGGDWKGELYFYDDIGEPEDLTKHTMERDNLVETLHRLVNDERIIKFEEWRNPLFNWQNSLWPNASVNAIVNGLLYHAFIVIKTTHNWWSIGKSTDGITLQRSKYWKNVTYEYKRKKRPQGIISPKIKRNRGPLQMPCDSTFSIYDIFDRIDDTHELTLEYHLLNDNCKDFATRIYKYCNNVRKNGGYANKLAASHH